MVLRVLSSAPFEPLILNCFMKTAVLLALASVQLVGDLIDLLVKLACMWFAPGDTRVIICPNPFCVPKVLTASFRSQVIDLPALGTPALQAKPGLKVVCPAVRALCIFTKHTQPLQRLEQLFVCFGTQARI